MEASVNFKPRRRFSRNRSRYPLNRRLGGLQSQSGRSREGKSLSFVPGFNPQRPAQSQVLIPTDLSRLQCCNCRQRICFVNVNSTETPVHVLRLKVRWYIFKGKKVHQINLKKKISRPLVRHIIPKINITFLVQKYTALPSTSHLENNLIHYLE